MSEQISGEEKISVIIKEISKLNLGQLSALIDKIKEEYNIKEDAIVQAANTTQTSEEVEEKTNNVSIKLVDIGSQKVPIYNLIRTIHKELKGTEITLIEAKKLTEVEGGIILENIPQAKAEEIKKQLEEKGAKLEIK